MIRRLLTWLFPSPSSSVHLPAHDESDHCTAEQRQQHGDLRMVVLRAEAAVVLRQLQGPDDADHL